MNSFSAIMLSSLSKVFPNKIYGEEQSSAEIAKGQSFSFQLALIGDDAEYDIDINSELNKYIKAYKVGYVPMTKPTYDSCQDDDYLTKEAGDCPDPLLPLEGCAVSVSKTYTAIWIYVDAPKKIEAGSYSIAISFSKNGFNVATKEFMLKIHDAALPEQELKFTQWFHTDCIANFHGVEVYSEEHWSLIEKYISMATEHGINMILTPVLTPPLDTEVGGERTTVQLVKIVKDGENYAFDFSKLERFIDICIKCNVKYFEISHMFTQWGARNTPKVVAEVNGKEEKIFGWDTDATSVEYICFLNKFIPSIIETFVKKGIDKKRICFHVSDEPNNECIEQYEKAYRALEKLIVGCEQMDAISHFDFYEKGIIKTPVVATNAIEPFLKAGVEGLWCYYCCAQHEKVSNRFMAMPSYRNRVIGVQMYKCSIVGFLHWGYNFYNLQYSKGQVNPYEVTDAGGSFPSGDSFSVYPYRDGVTPSLRIKVFKNALEDMRLLKLLEQKIGKAEVDALIDRVAGMEVTFTNYPKTESFFKKLYEEIFKIL